MNDQSSPGGDSNSSASTSRPAIAAEAWAEFKKLFWAARDEHIKGGQSATAEGPTHQRAMQYAREHGILGAEELLQASLLSCQDNADDARKILDGITDRLSDELRGHRLFVLGSALRKIGDLDGAIGAYQNAIDTPGYDAPGYAWNNLGNAFTEKGEYDEAIAAFRKAIETPGYDTHGDAWNNLGIALSGKGEYDEAIAAYQKAIDTPGYYTPGNAWYNMGITSSKNGEYDEAVAAFRKAIETPGYDTPGDAWNNLGIALTGKGEYGQAVDAFKTAINSPGYDAPHLTRRNLAATLRQMGKSDDALAELQRITSEPDSEGQHAKARLLKSLIEKDLSPNALQPAERIQFTPTATSALRDSESAESRMEAKIKGAKESRYDKYLKQPSSGRDNQLCILRGWSSSVTLLEGSKGQCLGGGCFLRWRGKGVVIDPGLDFLRNFHDAEFHGREIDGVILSHNHPDHNADIRHIDDLRYEIHQACIRSGKDEPPPPYVLVFDADTRDQHKELCSRVLQRHHPITLDIGRCNPRDRVDSAMMQGLPFELTYFKAQHSADVPGATSFCIQLVGEDGKTFKLGYTADTAYYSELKDHLAGCDVVIAHISQPDAEEFGNPNHVKKYHLGYRGLQKLVGEIDTPVVLIGEFWAGLADLRIDLAKGLLANSKAKCILPTSIGMNLSLPALKIECTECGDWTPYKDIRVAPPPDLFGPLAYLCSRCWL